MKRLIQDYPDGGDQEQLYAYVLCGYCYLNGHKERNPLRPVKSQDRVQLKFPNTYVSRAGHKLAFFLAQRRSETNASIDDKVFWDIGCATGGFTQALLDHGAAQVYAVDSAYNVLDYSLRVHPQVTVFERTNATSLPALERDPDLAVVDVSFRSIRGLIATILRRCNEARAFVLCKPQFELQMSPYSFENFDGVIRDETLVDKLVDFVVEKLMDEGCQCDRKIESPLRGAKGNVEIFLELSLMPSAKLAR